MVPLESPMAPIRMSKDTTSAGIAELCACGVRTATPDDRTTSKTNADAGERAMSMLQD